MKFIKSTFPIIIILCWTIEIFAQANFRPGYIINHNNDSVFGTINYKGDIYNSKNCLFKPEGKLNETEYSPNDIKGYRFIDGKYFVSKEIKIDSVEKHLFLEYLIQGALNVYFYRDIYGEHYLVEMSDNFIYELKNEKKEIYVNGILSEMETKEYIRILNYLLKDSEKALQKVENLKRDHQSLINIAKLYHKDICPEQECLVFEKKINKIKIHFGPVLGVNVSKFHVVDDVPEHLIYLKNCKISTSYNPSFGIFIKSNLPGINEKLFLQYQVMYSNQRINGNGTYSESTNGYKYINDLNISRQTFSNTLTLRYEWPQGKIRPTLALGGFFNNHFYLKFKSNTDIYFSWGDLYFNHNNTENPFSKWEGGLNLSFGALWEVFNQKIIHLDVIYQHEAGFGSIRSKSYSFNLGLQLF